MMMVTSRLLSFIPKGYVDVTKETSLGPCLRKTSFHRVALRNNGRGRYRVVQRALNRRKTWVRGTLGSRGSRADPHYHIVTTFEAKESGAPGVLARGLGISGVDG